MWTRTREDIELSVELNEIARRLLRLEPAPGEVTLTAADIAPAEPGKPAQAFLAGLDLPRTAARLHPGPSAAVRFTRVHGAATIRLDARRTLAA